MDNEFEQSRKVLAAKRKSLVLTRQGKGNKPLAAQAIDEDEEDALVLILNSATPIQLRFKELCGGFYTTLRSPLQFLQCKHRIHY